MVEVIIPSGHWRTLNAGVPAEREETEAELAEIRKQEGPADPFGHLHVQTCKPWQADEFLDYPAPVRLYGSWTRISHVIKPAISAAPPRGFGRESFGGKAALRRRPQPTCLPWLPVRRFRRGRTLSHGLCCR